MTYSIESIRPGDGESRHLLMRQAFGGSQQFDADAPDFAPGQVVAAYAGEELIGSVATFGFAMTWGGRQVPCGGVSGVAVAPQARGRGLARQMLAESFARMRARGEVISALYPTTATLYRSVGFEVVGAFARRWIPLASIPTAPAADLDWARVDFADPAFPELLDRHAARHDGWIQLDRLFWDWRVHHWAKEKGNRFAYVGSRDGEARAAMVFSYAPAADQRDSFDLLIEALAAPDSADLAAAFGFLAGHTTTAGRLQTTLPASVLARILPHSQRAANALEWPWMLRIVDPAGAVAARGFPSSVSGAVELTVVDDAIPDNSGAFVLEVGGGTAALTPGGSGAVRLTVQELAVAYAGDTGSLVAADRLAGATTKDTDLLTAAFASTPTLPVHF